MNASRAFLFLLKGQKPGSAAVPPIDPEQALSRPTPAAISLKSAVGTLKTGFRTDRAAGVSPSIRRQYTTIGLRISTPKHVGYTDNYTFNQARVGANAAETDFEAKMTRFGRGDVTNAQALPPEAAEQPQAVAVLHNSVVTSHPNAKHRATLHESPES